MESSPKANQAVLWCVGESEGGGSAQNVNVVATITIVIIIIIITIIAIISGIFITNINSVINLTMIMTTTSPS